MRCQCLARLCSNVGNITGSCGYGVRQGRPFLRLRRRRWFLNVGHVMSMILSLSVPSAVGSYCASASHVDSSATGVADTLATSRTNQDQILRSSGIDDLLIIRIEPAPLSDSLTETTCAGHGVRALGRLRARMSGCSLL